MGYLFLALIMAWVAALKTADRIDRGARIALACALGGGYLFFRLLGSPRPVAPSALASVAFALVCFAVLSLLRSADGIVRWLLLIGCGTLLLFLGVPLLENYLAEAWWRSPSRTEAHAPTPDGVEGRDAE